MSDNKNDKKINMFNKGEVDKICELFNCSPYDLYNAYRKVGDSFDDLSTYIIGEYEKNIPQRV